MQLFWLLLLLYLQYDKENKKSIQTDPSEVLIIDTDSSDKSILTNGKGDTLYVKEGDSVLIDRIDIKK